MANDWRADKARVEQAARIDITMPSAIRIADYFDGGRDNFEVDRKAARALVATAPVIGAVAPARRSFLRRVVRYLMVEAGVRQFLFVGITLAATNAHQVVWSADPGCRIVVADDDPLVLAHARALIRPVADGVAGHPERAVGYVHAGPRDPAAIVAGASATLDFGQPVAVIMMFVLGFIQKTATAADFVSALADGMASGSHFAIHHLASDLDPALKTAVRRWNQQSLERITLRSHAEVESLVAGLELVPPGVVPISEWHPDPADPHSGTVVPLHGVVARKP